MNELKNTRILVVDDSATARYDLQFLLKDMVTEENTFVTSDYQGALYILENESIDIALVDLQMPTWNGADLIMEMHDNAQLKSTQVIVVTATGEDNVLKMSIEHIVFEYLHKPVEKEELRKAMLECLRSGKDE